VRRHGEDFETVYPDARIQGAGVKWIRQVDECGEHEDSARQDDVKAGAFHAAFSSYAISG
jgi:hypothetical protein